MDPIWVLVIFKKKGGFQKPTKKPSTKAHEEKIGPKTPQGTSTI